MSRALRIKLAIAWALFCGINLLALAASHVPLEVFLGSIAVAVAVVFCVPDDCFPVETGGVDVDPTVIHCRPDFTPEQRATLNDVIARTERPVFKRDWLERHIANVTKGGE